MRTASAEPTTEPPVRARGLRRVHGSGPAAVTALDGVDLDVAAGTMTAVMGPSGSGKSTLLHCAAGLDRPDAGTVRLAGVDLAGLDEAARTRLRRDRVGFVFQSYNLVEPLDVATNVALPLLLAGRRGTGARVRAALDAVGLAGTARRRPAELSGGQQQRVAIARALVVRPRVLFADEPTGALDSHTGRQVLHLLRILVDQTGAAVVVVTHEPLVAASADRVVFLRDGRVVDELAGPRVDAVTARMSRLAAGGR